MRALPRGLMVLGFIGIAVVGFCGGNEGVRKEIIAQGRTTREITPTATSTNKVVIGVLDFEVSGSSGDQRYQKKALMRELKRNTRVKLVDIRESCSLSDLKRQGYERAERFKNIHQLDMILHVQYLSVTDHLQHYFSFINLYTKKVKKVSIELTKLYHVRYRGISRKILLSQDLNRVLRAKKKVLGKKEVVVPREVGESPEEIEDFLIQKGPTLIAEGEYHRVLELTKDLLGRRRRNVQIQTLECFANLKGWVSDKDQSCKWRWWNLRERLINSGDNEATPILVIVLKDEDPYLRMYAAELLANIGDERALKDLRAAAENDENYKVRKYAKRAYEQIWGEKF
jgi:hypothetical protein